MRTLCVGMVRVEKGKELEARIQEYKVEELPGTSILGILETIRRELDPTIYYEASCRSSVCGTCAIMINGKPMLACKTQTANLPEKIFLSPLRGFPVIRDLAADKSEFFSRLNREKVKGWVDHAVAFNPEHEFLMPDSLAEEIYNADRCIECGICVAGCLSAQINKGFVGAAGLNKILRFVLDPRDKRGITNMPVGEETFCHGIGNCEVVCPKEIPLASHLGRLKRITVLAWTKQIFRKLLGTK